MTSNNAPAPGRSRHTRHRAHQDAGAGATARTLHREENCKLSRSRARMSTPKSPSTALRGFMGNRVGDAHLHAAPAGERLPSDRARVGRRRPLRRVPSWRMFEHEAARDDPMVRHRPLVGARPAPRLEASRCQLGVMDREVGTLVGCIHKQPLAAQPLDRRAESVAPLLAVDTCARGVRVARA